MNGFNLGISGEPPVSADSNCPSAKKHGEIIDNYLQDEIKHGVIAGPFVSPPLGNLHINRFGVIPKSTPGKWRMITDLSFPQENRVNSCISDEHARVYVGVPAAVSKIMTLGRGTLIAKFDLRRAYRLLPVHIEDRHFLGMRWRDRFYVDLALPFGIRSAPQIFSRFADILQFILHNAGPVENIQHYLDDFFVAGAPTTDDCQSALLRSIEICSQLGVPLAEEKTEGPTTSLTFLGYELDSVAMELRVPEVKLRKYASELKAWRVRRRASKRQLLSLIGRLEHCCNEIELGRPFLRRLIVKAHSVKDLDSFVALSQWEHDDLRWWNTLFENWNGRSLFLLPEWEKSPDFVVTSDAAGSIGFGAFYQNDWFAQIWSVDSLSLNIAIKELIPVVIAAKLWGFQWKRKRIEFQSDNMAVVCCLKTGSCKNRHLAFLLRELTILAITNSFTFTATHIEGVKNRKADALSRFELQDFFRECPDMNRKPLEVPQDFLQHLLFPSWTKNGNPV